MRWSGDIVPRSANDDLLWQPSHASYTDVMTGTRRPRKDAVANHERLIVAAFELLGSRDAQISVNDLAAAAGVGAGTAYRHFPTREHLIRALYDRAVADLSARIIDPPEAATAWERLEAFVVESMFAVADTPGLRAVMRHMYDIDPEYAPARPMLAQLEAILAEAKSAGVLREDVVPGDVALAVFTTGSLVDRPVGVERESLLRLTLLTLDGMRADGKRSELPTGVSDPVTFHSFVHRSHARPHTEA